MRVLSAITDPIAADRILRCLALPSRARALATSGDRVGHTDSAVDESFGGLPEFDFDQSVDESFGGLPEFDFDQSRPSRDDGSSAWEFRDIGATADRIRCAEG